MVYVAEASRAGGGSRIAGRLRCFLRVGVSKVGLSGPSCEPPGEFGEPLSSLEAILIDSKSLEFKRCNSSLRAPLFFEFASNNALKN